MDHKTLNLYQDTIYFVPCTDVHTGPCGVLLYQARHKPLPNKTEQTGELKENEQGGRRRTADSFFFLRKWLDFIDILFLLPSPDRHSLKKEKIHISSQEK